jgi:hypothetical protein
MQTRSIQAGHVASLSNDTSGANRWKCLACYRGTPLEKYINGAAKVLDEHSRVEGVQSVSISLRYTKDGNVEFVEQRTLLPGWRSNDGAVDLFPFRQLREAKRRSNPVHDLRIFDWIAARRLRRRSQ